MIVARRASVLLLEMDAERRVGHQKETFLIKVRGFFQCCTRRTPGANRAQPYNDQQWQVSRGSVVKLSERVSSPKLQRCRRLDLLLRLGSSELRE